MAEVDGNRTRHRGIATITRFEGGGAHQVPGHLQDAPALYPCGAVPPAGGRRSAYGWAMKKLLLVAVLIGLTAFAVRKLRVG